MKMNLAVHTRRSIRFDFAPAANVGRHRVPAFSLAVLASAWMLLAGSVALAAEAPASPLDRRLAAENSGKDLTPAAPASDLAFLRRVSVDFIGRIPTEAELRQYLAWPAAERRSKLIDRLLADERFADRWTVFFADLLRIRSDSPGGDTLVAFVHQSLTDHMPYDELCRQLISVNGKAGKAPQVGFILGDNADPLAMAGVTAQVFMGIRVSCAQCHDHPFDVWTREQFYGLAAYYGRTRRVESQLTKAVYTTEMEESAVLWPPEDVARGKPRKAMDPKFPFQLASTTTPAAARLKELRRQRRPDWPRPGSQRARRSTTCWPKPCPGGPGLGREQDGCAGRRECRVAAGRPALEVERDLYRESQLRRELAELVTSPNNRYFSRALVNRLWAEFLGRGFVEPLDDFNAQNPPSHPQTLDYLADEFVAGGFDLRTPIRLIVSSQAYARGHATGLPTAQREAAEKAFVAQPRRRMLSESLFDSIVLAGHLFEPKHGAGENMREVTTYLREAVPREGTSALKPGAEGRPEMGMAARSETIPGGYDLESAIEVNFDSVLADAKDAPAMEAMQKVSTDELESSPNDGRPGQIRRTQGDHHDRRQSAVHQCPADGVAGAAAPLFADLRPERRATPWANSATTAPRCGRP